MKKPTFRFVKLIILALLGSYALLPFINGIGCNYIATTKDSRISYLSSCRVGIVKTIAWDIKSGQKKVYWGLLAKKNNNLIILTTHVDELSNPRLHFTHDSPFILRNESIWSAKVMHTKSKDIVLVGNPAYLIFEANISGKLGFW